MTARALANQLHVSVGALYNYAGSMPDAVAAGEDIINAQVVECVGNRPEGVSAVHSLLGWAAKNPGLASLYFDPSRRHGSIPAELAVHFQDFGPDVTASFEDFRTWIGLALRQGGGVGEAEFELIDAAEALLPAYLAARRELEAAPADKSFTAPFEVSDLERELERQAGVGATTEREALIRFHSARIMVGMADVGTDHWNFRALSKTTGIALAALHAVGSRNHHVRQAGIDSTCAVVSLADSHTPDGTDMSHLVPRTLSHFLDEAFQDFSATVNWSTARSILERLDLGPQASWCTVPAVTMAFSIFISAHHQRENVEGAWASAPQLVANFVTQLVADQSI